MAKWQAAVASGKWRHWLAKNLIKPAPEPEVEAHTGQQARHKERDTESGCCTGVGQRERGGLGIGGAWQELALFSWRQEALECVATMVNA